MPATSAATGKAVEVMADAFINYICGPPKAQKRNPAVPTGDENTQIETIVEQTEPIMMIEQPAQDDKIMTAQSGATPKMQAIMDERFVEVVSCSFVETTT